VDVAVAVGEMLWLRKGNNCRMVYRAVRHDSKIRRAFWHSECIQRLRISATFLLQIDINRVGVHVFQIGHSRVPFIQ
jgi:hypothetical protein